MIKSKKSQLIIILIVAGITFSVLGQEHNPVKKELQFKIGQEEQKWITDLDELEGIYQEDKAEKSVIKPTHVSIMIIEHPRVPRIYWTEISNNPIGRTMSKQQQEFITEANGRIRKLKRKEKGFEFRWYAVSQEDAKKMVQAFIDVWNTKVDKKLKPYLREQQEHQDKIAEIIKKLSEKQKKLEEAEKKYKEVKDARYFLFNDGQAYDKASETMLKIGSMLDILKIELVGIQEKLKVLESYRRTKRLPRKALSDETIDKLDQMFVELMVELGGVEAKIKISSHICEQAKEFLNLYNQRNNLNSEAGSLQRDLKISENDLREAERMLSNPPPEILPPKVFQNQVTIYPVNPVK